MGCVLCQYWLYATISTYLLVFPVVFFEAEMLMNISSKTGESHLVKCPSKASTNQGREFKSWISCMRVCHWCFITLFCHQPFLDIQILNGKFSPERDRDQYSTGDRYQKKSHMSKQTGLEQIRHKVEQIGYLVLALLKLIDR